MLHRTFIVAIVGDRLVEGNETFGVLLSDASGATIARGTATVTIVDNDKALMASEPAPAGAQADRALTQDALDAAVAQALVQWLAEDPNADFADLTFAIEDLPGLLLAQASGSHIVVDATAAGWGWSVMYADAAPRMDLLAAVAHELGHVLGHEHGEGGVMAETLSPTRRAPLAAPTFTTRPPAIVLRTAVAASWISSPRAGSWVGSRATTIADAARLSVLKLGKRSARRG